MNYLKINAKQMIVSAILMMAGTVVSFGEIPRMAIGYTGDELPGSSAIGIDESGTLKAAVLVNPAEIGDLTDLKIMGFNVGLASRINVSSMIVWASETPESEPIVSVAMESRPVKGWNEVSLKDLVDIPCRPLYIGYTIETSGASYPVAAAGESFPDGLWMDNGDGWEDLSDSAGGMLAMSMMITAKNLPSYNLTFVNAEIPPVMHSRIPTAIPVEIRNSGAMTVTGFTITCDEGNGLKQDFDISSVIEPNGRLKMVLEVLPLSNESETPFELTLSITEIQEGEDSNPADNSISAMTRVSRFTFTKRALVDEFTTMSCMNCPRAAKLLHQALDKEEYRERVMAVCHHSGYYTDFLTQPCDLEMEVLYGSDSTFAPAMCFDRRKQEGGAVAVDVPLVLEGLTGIFDALLADTAEVDLNVNAKWNDDTQKIDIVIEGGCASETPPENADHITVYVLENNINTPMQAGADGEYLQQHVIRAYNATWGEPIEWEANGKFNYSVALSIPDGCVQDNMEVIGLISHYDASDPLDCAVFNTARAPYIDWTEYTEVEELYDCSCKTRYYDLTGRQVNTGTKGILLKESISADGKRSVEKVLIR